MNLKAVMVSAAITAATVALASTAASAAALPHRPAPQPRLQVGYEVDNGTTWTLTDSLAQAHSTGPQAGYADAGVVVPLGPVLDFTGIRATGSQNLAENIWIADGPQAYLPGTHPLSTAADFDYGFQQAGDTYYRTDGQHAGQTLTLAELKADFGGYQAYAWVGIDDSGTTGYGYVTSVNGRPLYNIVGVKSGRGDVTAYVLGL
jgi:hypothetical protein